MQAQFVTVKEVAALLQICERHTREMIHRGQLLAINIAPDGQRPRYRIPKEVVDNLANPNLAGNLVHEVD